MADVGAYLSGQPHLVLVRVDKCTPRMGGQFGPLPKRGDRHTNRKRHQTTADVGLAAPESLVVQSLAPRLSICPHAACMRSSCRGDAASHRLSFAMQESRGLLDL